MITKSLLPNSVNPYYAVMKRAVKASETGMPYTHTIIPMIWTSHTPDCSVYMLN